MIVAPGAYLIVIPDVCKNPIVPFRRHSGRAQCDPESVTAVEFPYSTDSGFCSP